jgi:hypothetical protein
MVCIRAIAGFPEIIRDKAFGDDTGRYAEYASDIYASATHLRIHRAAAARPAAPARRSLRFTSGMIPPRRCRSTDAIA